MHPFNRLTPIFLTTLTCVTPAWAMPGEDGDEGLPARVVQAHRDIERGHVSAHYTAYFSHPDETEWVSTTYQVWLDRPAQRLRVDRPGFTLVCDGQTVYLRSESLPGRHLETPLGGKLDYAALVDLVPDVNDPVLPTVILMLADEPMFWLSAGHANRAQSLRPQNNDPESRPRLRLTAQLEELTLACDPGSHLLDEGVLLIDPQQFAGTDLTETRLHYQFEITPAAEAFPDKTFQFETEGSQAFATMDELLAPTTPTTIPHQAAQAGPGQPVTLLGQTLPEIELQVLDQGEMNNLATLDEGLVVLEFFATWSRPSLTDLGDLVAYRDWAQEQGYDLRVIAVNVMEKPKQVREWLERLSQQTGIDYDLPVLLDVAGEAANALGLPTVPRTVVLVDGAIVEVFGGLKPEFGQMLRDATPGWLGEEDTVGEGRD